MAELSNEYTNLETGEFTTIANFVFTGAPTNMDRCELVILASGHFAMLFGTSPKEARTAGIAEDDRDLTDQLVLDQSLTELLDDEIPATVMHVLLNLLDAGDDEDFFNSIRMAVGHTVSTDVDGSNAAVRRIMVCMPVEDFKEEYDHYVSEMRATILDNGPFTDVLFDKVSE